VSKPQPNLEQELARAKTRIAELECKKSLQDIQFAMEQVGLGIHFVATNGKLKYVNEFACKLLGYTHEEMMSMNVSDIDPNIPAGHFEEICRPLREQPGRLETTQRTKDGRIIPVEVNFQFIPGNDNTEEYFVSFIRDQSRKNNSEKEKDRLHKQLQHLQKMESIGQLTGGIAHDFNNMLAVIMGFSHLLGNLFKQEEVQKEKGQAYLHEIVNASDRATELISQMLAFSRRLPEQNQDETPAIPIQPVIKDTLSLLRSSLPSSIQLEHHFENDPLKARIQPSNLHQILLNLGINARDAIPEYGKININLAQHRLSGFCQSCHDCYNGDFIELKVTDSGTGIPDEILGQIFDPFFSTKEVNKGSGMGLSVVHGLVHDAGGHISLNSKQDEGSSISILLPLSNDHENSETANDDNTTDAVNTLLNGKKIMVVDDEHMITSMLSELFCMYGANVVTFNQSVNALNYFMQTPDSIDLVITDETMPELSGLDMSQHILKKQPTVPVIICTGHSEYINSTIAEKQGISGFMMKPLDLDKLLDLVNRIISAKNK